MKNEKVAKRRIIGLAGPCLKDLKDPVCYQTLLSELKIARLVAACKDLKGR